MSAFVIAAFYQFTDLPDSADYQAGLTALGLGEAVTGTILLASEGVNGTIAGPRAGIDKMLGALRALPGCAAMPHKESFHDRDPFYRLKVRVKKEIVSMGVPSVRPADRVGTRVAPEAWNELISDPDVLVIDTRNRFEVAVGSFKNAIDPQTTSFRDFPAWVEKNRAHLAGRKIAMFCTGGIRCEKATSLLLDEGMGEVYHLEGGILNYLEAVPEPQSLWEGECFVFDHRVSVTHDLEPGTHDMCHACRMPLRPEEMTSPFYVKGVSCPKCHAESSIDQKTRFAQRQLQIDLAKARNEPHMGKVYADSDTDAASTDERDD
ncbi:MAG: rhodanese-related sulfurtransferase [Pseudomonadota bacterium]